MNNETIKIGDHVLIDLGYKEKGLYLVERLDSGFPNYNKGFIQVRGIGDPVEISKCEHVEIEFTVSSRSGFYCTTDLELEGRGISQVGDGRGHMRRKKTYHITKRAMDKLKVKHTCYYISKK